MIRALKCLFLAYLAVVVSGCAVANYVVDPYTNIRFEAKDNVNPDASGRSSPLVLRVYELRSAEAFESAGFFDLYDEPEGVLDRDLLSQSEIVLRPGIVRLHEMTVDKKAEYIGIIAAFQNIEEAEWKLVLDASPKGYKDINILIDKLELQRVKD